MTHRIPFAACAAIASCHDCHTPGYFLGKPDMARDLGGSDVGFGPTQTPTSFVMKVVPPGVK